MTFKTRKHRRQILGRRGENIACNYLHSMNMQIIARNWKCRAGELDIIARSPEYLLFVEVKTIRAKPNFIPAANLSMRQRRRNLHAAKIYMKSRDITGIPAKLDLIEVTIFPDGKTALQHNPDYMPMILPAPNPVSASPPAPVSGISFADKLFSNRCPGCGKPLNEPEKHFCPACLADLIFFDRTMLCPGCGGENSGALDLCSRCLIEPPRLWKQALALFAYRKLGKELIHRLKFSNEVSLARPLGMMAADMLHASGMKPDAMIPIPLNPLRALLRSYNQAALIADVISWHFPCPVIHPLKRKFSFRKQSALSRTKRHRGLQKAFYLSSSKAIAGKHLLLIDDVFTTGSTLHAAANTLLQAGAAKVSVLTIARAITYSKKLKK